MMKRAGVEFLYTFLGALVTLVLSTQAFDLDSDVIPDMILLMEIVLSALVAGMIAVIGVAREWLASMNGNSE
jgi:prepilin signal peptidase PulO-like enzyme (type II secretory pathway)